ncbi:MAG TPA: MIP family channel protein [Planctomycetaceae bacterium]|nr:MIP family channel protein [Planctomycetaceae bacterium]
MPVPESAPAQNEPAAPRNPSLAAVCAAEFLGTFLLVFFGCGAVHSAVLTGAQSGLWQVAIVWGVAIMLAAYVCGGISGAHINPAITLALAAWGRFDRRRVPPYIASQLVGAFAAAALLFVLYGPQLAAREAAKGVRRGEPGSEITAMCYGEYYPNPGPISTGGGFYDAHAHDAMKLHVPHTIAFIAEIAGTLVLALVVFALTDPRNTGAPAAEMAPVFIGLAVAALISIIAPLTQACFNPARDFGPRLFAYFAGWGRIAIPGPDGIGFFTVYIVAPVVGAWLGAGLYERILRPALTAD